ncbi:MAG: tRNA 2-thiouridine(34) synthase MnmA [Planctomycetaceae bacterium]|nr:tRNA 2-thiouridine(34) synthase MnmA [Planctomycetaceae bacterium]
MTGRVVLAMSGGVDSSAAAVLLHQQGYQVIGLFMRSGESEAVCALPAAPALPILNQESHRQGCCSASDAADARRVADRLGIPFHSLNFQDSFRRIKDYFADEYLAGRTPNPCVQCNNWLKFGKLWEFAQQVGADYIATGHYARILCSPETDAHGLFRGLDENKDQSYVLFGIARSLLPRILFPIGDFQKSEIRRLAGEAGLRVAGKKDSYEICFVPDNDYAGFLHRYRTVGETSGDFVDTAGNILGPHPGYEHFTIGQRKGLGIAFGEPRFVVKIDAQSRQVVLGKREDLATSVIRIDQLNWLVDVPEREFACSVKVRYRHQAEPCTVRLIDDDHAEIRPDHPIQQVAPGQAAVFYRDQQVLGGGWIVEREG